VLRALGRDREARDARDELERLSRSRFVNPLALAAATPLSDHRTRLRRPTRAVDEREGTVSLLNVDPIIDDLRTDPALQALLDRLGPPRIQSLEA
jgi:hypothetical protein